jgi:hypothetical protein
MTDERRVWAGDPRRWKVHSKARTRITYFTYAGRGPDMGMSPTQLVADRAARLSSTTTSTAILDAQGEEFDHILDAPRGTTDAAVDLANALRVSLVRNDADVLTMAACRHADTIDRTVTYCEGYARLSAGSRPDRREWVAVDGYVLELAKPRAGTFIDPPTDAVYYGVAIPAGRALYFHESEEHSRPFASYLDPDE